MILQMKYDSTLEYIIAITFYIINRTLIKYIEMKEINSNWKGILIAFGFLFQSVIGSIFENYCYTMTSKMIVQVRGSLIGLIYNKVNVI